MKDRRGPEEKSRAPKKKTPSKESRTLRYRTENAPRSPTAHGSHVGTSRMGLERKKDDTIHTTQDEEAFNENRGVKLEKGVGGSGGQRLPRKSQRDAFQVVSGVKHASKGGS